jgi:uncharacterized protein (TIGR02172 family)
VEVLAMKSILENNKLTLCLEGRIDTNNAAAVEAELFVAANANPGAEIAVDAEQLEYISSAGLRVLMKLRKQVKSALPILNVSPEVYDIFETTGFTEILDVQKRLRKVSLEGCEKIGEGGVGEIYRLDEDTIVKVYKPWMSREDVDRERSFARTAFVNGIPSVIAYDLVKTGDSYGVVFEMLRSDTLGAAMRDHPERMDEYVDKWVELAKTLHATHVKPGTFSNTKEVWRRQASNLTQWCSQEEIALLNSIIDDVPDSDTVVHNDLHPGNIMIQDGELVLIDMAEVTMGRPVFDLVSIYRDMIAAPTGPSAPLMERSTSMPSKLIMEAGNKFFQKYTGITDEGELAAYYQKIGLLLAFNVALVCGSGAEESTKLAPMLMEKMLRGVVIPNEQAIRALFKTM